MKLWTNKLIKSTLTTRKIFTHSWAYGTFISAIWQVQGKQSDYKIAFTGSATCYSGLQNALFIKVIRFKWNLVLILILDGIKGANLRKMRIIGNDNVLTKLSCGCVTLLQCTRSGKSWRRSRYTSVVLLTIGFCHFKLTPLNKIIHKTYGI